MAETKYGHLVKSLSRFHLEPKADIVGPGNADKLIWVGGKDLEGLELSFTWGFYSKLGDWHAAGRNPHTHPHDEVLVFVGLEPTDLDYLGAELEIALGEEQEKHVIDKPSAVVVPKGMPHCPLVTKRVVRPFGHYTIYLGSEYQTTWFGESKKAAPAYKSKTAKTKYGHLIKPLVTEERVPKMLKRFGAGVERAIDRSGIFRVSRIAGPGSLGPGNADQLVWLYGDDLEGFEVNFTWGFYSKAGLWHRGGGAHVHTVDEVLVFVGLEPTDIDYLGAGFEIDMGGEHERHIFDTPTVVICPRGLPHLPLVTRWVDKPYSFYVIALGAEHESPFVD